MGANLSWLGTDVFSDDPQISIFPNPASGQVTISLPGTASAEIRIFSITGLTVYRGTSSSRSCRIGLEGLAPGVYLVRVWSGVNVVTRKVYVE